MVLLVGSGLTLGSGRGAQSLRQGPSLCLGPGLSGVWGARPPAVRPTGARVSYTQHLLWEVCADSPAPRHRLFLAAVTVHYSHENRNSSPYLVLPWDTAPGARATGDPGLGRLVMHCLWSWVTAKASRGTGTPPPVVLCRARSLDQPELEGGEVGTGVWDRAAFP